MITVGGIGIYAVGHCVNRSLGLEVVNLMGPSMQPVIEEGDIALTEKRSVMKNTLKKGDIVIATSPVTPDRIICKRITGFEDEEMPPHQNKTIFSYSHIPPGHVWLEGDNTSASTDSRTYGPVPYGLIQGRVFYRLFPANRRGKIT